MFDILSILPGKKKLTQSGWHSFNAVCCVHRGHKPDRRGRGGIKFDGQTNWTMNCFNCQFSCSFTLGRSITAKTKQLLLWFGIDEMQIQRWSLESLQQKDLLDFTSSVRKYKHVHFATTKLPPSIELNPTDPAHKVYTNYLAKRKIDIDKYKFFITPTDSGRNSNRVIVPYTYKKKIVGNTSRFLDDRIPKYLNDQQPGYVFNIDSQNPNWQVCLVMEGIFDALSVDGCALMHNTISSEQAELLAQLNKRIIVVPDRDKAGLEMCDRALELGYSVSIPNWHTDVKDVNDAVIRYGKLPTIMSILQTATMSRIKIEMQRKKIIKGKQ
jgi:hypothetical protein